MSLINRLIILARKGIVQYYDNRRKLFNYIVTDANNINENKNLVYTHSLISLLGIANHKNLINIDWQEASDNVYKDTLFKHLRLRDMSLIMWLLAKENDERAENIYNLIRQFAESGIRELSTWELAWLVIALVYEYKRSYSPSKKALLNQYIDILTQRFIWDTGLFIHGDKRNNSIRSNISNFADQVYPIYALSKIAFFLDNGKCLNIAKYCANKIMSMQGEFGEWFWHYDASRGSVLQKYPIFSVHQDSMAPFAMMALSKVSDENYAPSIIKGINWINGNNQLRANMINANKTYIRRGIRRKYPFSAIQKLVTLGTEKKLINRNITMFDHSTMMEVIKWEHSYHLGWILYAFHDGNKSEWAIF